MDKGYFIAELGFNHNASIDIAKELIDMAIYCKADAVKLQKRHVSQMATKDILDKPYTGFPEWGDTYREFREYLEFTKNEYRELREYCRDKIDFIVTPFDIQSLEFLDDLDLDAIKIASHNLTDIPLLEEVSKRNKPIYLSTGMSSWNDIDIAVKTLDPKGTRTKDTENQLVIMHCVSSYPADIRYANLPMITRLKERYPNYHIGFSDHQNGISLPPVARVLGAKYFEKHITLDRGMKGLDQAYSLEMVGLKKCVRNIHAIEEAMVEYDKNGPLPWETMAYNDFRRTIVATQDIKEGTIITRDMLTTKAPNTGLMPKMIPEIIGKKALKDIKEDTHITFDMVDI